MRNEPDVVLMLGTSPSVRGGVSSVVATLREGGLFQRAKVRYVGSHAESSGLAKITQFGLALVATVQALVSGRILLVHAHVSSGASFWRKAMLLALARAFRVPTIFHLHSGAFGTFAAESGAFTAWAVRETLHRSSAVIVLSNSWRQWMLEFAPRARVVVIPNPVNLPRQEAHPARPARNQMLYLGLVSEAKGTFDLLCAWARFKQEVPGWKLVIGGYGDIDRLMQVAADQGVADDVDFRGWLAGPDKDRALSEADIFVLPSYREGMPVSILEAMAFGTAVIATEVGGIPDMMKTDVEGLLVSAGDIDALARSMIRLASSEELRRHLVSNARSHVETHYATELIVEQVCQLYGAVATTRRGPGSRPRTTGPSDP